MFDYMNGQAPGEGFAVELPPPPALMGSPGNGPPGEDSCDTGSTAGDGETTGITGDLAGERRVLAMERRCVASTCSSRRAWPRRSIGRRPCWV